MAQWQELLKLDSVYQERVRQLYDENFSKEIRHCLSDWIESQNWDLAADDEKEASNCFQKLLLQLDEQQSRSVQKNAILEGPDFPSMNSYLQYHFKEKPMKLAMIISGCLREEKKILASATQAQDCIANNPVMEKQKELDNKVKELRKQIWEAERDIKSLEARHDEHAWQNQVDQWTNELAPSQALQKQERLITLNQTKQMVLQQIANVLNLAQQIVSTLVEVELPEWKHRQQKACIGSPTNTCLDQLQMWFTTVTVVLQQMRQQLKKLQEQEQKYSSNDSSSVCTVISQIEELRLQLFKKLIENALVVEKQPCMPSLPHRPLILKTGVRFTVKIRFLAKLPEFNWLLKVKPVFDKDINENQTIKGFREFIFDKDDKHISKALDEEIPGGDLVAEFAHLSLKEHKARGNRSNVSSLQVTEELHFIKFVTQLQQPGLEVDIETSSLPIVVISSTSQIPIAWASVMWCNMLTGEPKSPSFFLSPPAATWEQLSQVLNWQFSSISEKVLNENQLSMLRDKLVDNSHGLVHWSNFCKNDRVWIWIDGILDLIKKHLLDLWNDGSIMGFVSRETAEGLLQDKQTGTFLLRFSESIKEGAITFSWVEHTNGAAHVHAVQPYTKKDLTDLPLPDTIHYYSLKDPRNMHVNPLLYLYPDTPKDFAFERYYNKPETQRPTLKVYLNRRLIPVSDQPTPPPSPTEVISMDTTEDGGSWTRDLPEESDPRFPETLLNLKRGLCE